MRDTTLQVEESEFAEQMPAFLHMESGCLLIWAEATLSEKPDEASGPSYRNIADSVLSQRTRTARESCRSRPRSSYRICVEQSFRHQQ